MSDLRNEARSYAQRLIENSIRRGSLAVNPITGSAWVPGMDSKKKQIERAVDALVGASHFKSGLPPEVGELPLTYADREELKKESPVQYVVALFARSLDHHRYVERHPSFPEFAASVVRCPFAPPVVQSANLFDRFPLICELRVGPGCYWEPTSGNV